MQKQIKEHENKQKENDTILFDLHQQVNSLQSHKNQTDLRKQINVNKIAKLEEERTLLIEQQQLYYDSDKKIETLQEEVSRLKAFIKNKLAVKSDNLTSEYGLVQHEKNNNLDDSQSTLPRDSHSSSASTTKMVEINTLQSTAQPTAKKETKSASKRKHEETLVDDESLTRKSGKRTKVKDASDKSIAKGNSNNTTNKRVKKKNVTNKAVMDNKTTERRNRRPNLGDDGWKQQYLIYKEHRNQTWDRSDLDPSFIGYQSSLAKYAETVPELKGRAPGTIQSRFKAFYAKEQQGSEDINNDESQKKTEKETNDK